MAMTAAEIAARLVKINAAIDAYYDGQAESVSIAGRTYTAQDIDKLEQWQKYYQSLLDQTNAGGSRPGVIRFVKSAGTF